MASFILQSLNGVFLFLPENKAEAAGAVYYVDNSISDVYTVSGTPDCTNYNPTTFSCSGGSASAYKTVADINAGSFSADDQILFRRGQTWREELVVPSSGTSGHPIIFGAYGTGNNPVFYRTLNNTSWWEYSLVKNGGFEMYDGMSNDGAGDTFTDDWQIIADTGNTVEAVGPGHIGDAALKITKPSAATSNAVIRTSGGTLALSANTTYYMEFYGKRDSGAGSCRVFLKDVTDNTYLNEDGAWRTNTDDESLNPSSLRVTESSWTRKSMSFTTPSTATAFTMQFGIRYDQIASCEWDDVYIVQGSAHNSARAWEGYWGTSIEAGILDEGIRMPQYNPYVNISPFVMTNGYFYNYGDTRYFYYRNDSGVPTNTEIGYWRHGIYMNNKSYITVQDIDIYGPGGSAGDGSATYTGIWIGGSSSNVTLKDMSVTHGNAYAAWSDSTTTNVIYDGIISAYNGDTGLYQNSNGGAVRNCIVHDNGRVVTDVGDRGGIGVYLGGNLDVYNNEVYRNGLDDDIGDMEISIVSPIGPVDITKNYVHDCIQGCMQVAEGGDGSTIAYNVINGFGTSIYSGDSSDSFSGIRVGGGVSGVADALVYNNVIANGTGRDANGGVVIVEADSTNTQVKNNIFYNNSSYDISVDGNVDTSGHSYDHNIFHRSSYTNAWRRNWEVYSSLAAWQAAFGQDANSLTSDPLFANASGSYSAATDFRLQSSSPAINSGAVIFGATSDYLGNSFVGNPDIGAFEANAGASTDAALSAITLSSGSLSPSFASSTVSYTSSVANSVSSVTITPTVNESHATVTVNGTTVVSGSSSSGISLSVGANTINVVVIAQNGSTTRNYTVVITRDAASSGGGSGGGGSSSVTHPKPKPREIKVSSIESNVVNLSLLVDDASEMSLSSSSDFGKAAWEKYVTSKTYNKTDNQARLYLKFKSSYSVLSDVVELDITSTSPVDDGSDTDISPYPAGTLLKTPDSFKTYVMIEGKKKWISTPEVFEQLGYQWTSIKEITASQLSAISDYEDNLIRTIGDYKVYLVVNGVRRHIPNPDIFLNYGFKWEEVKDVEQSVVDKYKNTYLIKESGKDGIYYLRSDGIRKLIPTDEVFKSYNDKYEDVQVVSRIEMDSYPLSNLICLEESNDIYLIQGNAKRRVASPQVFAKHNLNWNYIIKVNKIEFDFYKNDVMLE